MLCLHERINCARSTTNEQNNGNRTTCFKNLGMDTRDFISIKYHRDWNFSTPIQTINYLEKRRGPFQERSHFRNRETTIKPSVGGSCGPGLENELLTPATALSDNIPDRRDFIQFYLAGVELPSYQPNARI